MLNIIHHQRNANQNHNEVPSHASQNGCHQKVHKQDMLERVQRKRNPLTLLVGMQTSIATMENSVEIPLKAGNRTPIAKSLQSCPTLCDPTDCSLSGSSIHGIFQARVLEWVAISFSRGSSRAQDQTTSPAVAGEFFTAEPWASPIE